MIQKLLLLFARMTDLGEIARLWRRCSEKKGDGEGEEKKEKR